MLISNGKSLFFSLYGADTYVYLPSFSIRDFTLEEQAPGITRAHFNCESTGDIRLLYSTEEALKLIDPLQDLTLQELLHAAQVRMENRNQG